ncbi:hypothetical protein D021_2107A, partial [Vibrio parahaemolyticus 10296]
MMFRLGCESSSSTN